VLLASLKTGGGNTTAPNLGPAPTLELRPQPVNGEVTDGLGELDTALCSSGRCARYRCGKGVCRVRAES
jgi:hypothetical protein